ncbi:unnamed protein product, partial [Polarella glacialis]
NSLLKTSSHSMPGSSVASLGPRPQTSRDVSHKLYANKHSSACSSSPSRSLGGSGSLSSRSPRLTAPGFQRFLGRSSSEQLLRQGSPPRNEEQRHSHGLSLAHC